MLRLGCFPLRSVLSFGPGVEGIPVARRSLVQGQGRAVLLGLYGLGGFRGISRATIGNPEVTRYLNGVCAEPMPDAFMDGLVCVQKYGHAGT